MSLSDAKKLEDLKKKSNDLWDALYSGLDGQRKAAITSFLDDMTGYLNEQGFEVQSNGFHTRGFTAKYGDITIKAEVSGDDEPLVGADYSIDIYLGKLKTNVILYVKRASFIQPPQSHQKVADQIKDYETRYIPGIEAIDPKELDGSYKLLVAEPGSKNPQRKVFSTGREVIDFLFEKK